MDVHPATSADLVFMNEALFQLNKLHYEVMPSVYKTPEEIAKAKNLERYINGDDCIAFIAKVDGIPVGFVAGQVNTLQSPIIQPIITGSIDELYVSEGSRGKGVGTRLVNELEAWLKAKGASELAVEVWSFNEAAQGFYSRLGLVTRVMWAAKPLNMPL